MKTEEDFYLFIGEVWVATHLPGQHLPKHHPHRVDVAPGPDVTVTAQSQHSQAQAQHRRSTGAAQSQHRAQHRSQHRHPYRVDVALLGPDVGLRLHADDLGRHPRRGAHHVLERGIGHITGSQRPALSRVDYTGFKRGVSHGAEEYMKKGPK